MRLGLKRSGSVGDPYRGLKRLGEIEARVGDAAPLRCLKAASGGAPCGFSARTEG
jgi:hypothetical protein